MGMIKFDVKFTGLKSGKLAKFKQSKLIIEKELTKSLIIIKDLFIKAMREQRLAGRLTDNTGLNKRSGKLQQKKNFVSKISRKRGGILNLNVGIGKGLKYPRLQEKGGTIVPRRAKYLAIPLNHPLVRTPRLVQKYKSPRNFPGKLFSLTTANGFKYLVHRRGKKLHFLYSLRESVKIPPRMGAAKVVSGEATDFKRNSTNEIENVRRRLIRRFNKESK